MDPLPHMRSPWLPNGVTNVRRIGLTLLSQSVFRSIAVYGVGRAPMSDPLFIQLVNQLQARLRADYDFYCVVTGLEGVGKSSLALQLAYAVDPTFTHEAIAWDVDEVVKTAIRLPPLSSILLDEAFDAAFNRQAMSGANKKWVKFIGTARARNLGIFVCFPRFQSLDPYSREHRVTHWINVTARGRATLRTPVELPDGTKTWSSKYILRFRDATYLPFYQAYKEAKMEYVNKQGESGARTKKV